MAEDLSIVIVSYNTREDLERCVSSLCDHPPVTPHGIVVVDNASSDGSAALVRRRFPMVSVIDMPANTGFAHATNVGIRQSRGSLLLLLNSDTVVPAGAADALAAILASRPEIGIVGPRLVDPSGNPELSFGRMLGPLNELRQKLLGVLYDRRVPAVVRRVSHATHAEQYPDWISGACLLVRRTDAEAAGLFDERFLLYGEDVDFCAAMRRLGKRVFFTPSVEVVHARGRSVAVDPDGSRRAYRRSQLAFYAKHHPRWSPLLRAYLAVRGQLPR